MDALLQLYLQWCGNSPSSVESLPKAGSNRQYIRLTAPNHTTAIGVIGSSTEENSCFVFLSRHFYELGLPVPQVYAFSKDKTCYIQEDLGTVSLYDLLAGARKQDSAYPPHIQSILGKTIRSLAHIQIEGSRDLDFSHCLTPQQFDKQAVMFDLNYFKYNFLKTTDLPFDEVKLEHDLQQLSDDLTDHVAEEHYFLYRDFQARNVMLEKKTGSPRFIDFQGGRKGPLQYDVASFLWQASARYSQELRNTLIREYLDEVRLLIPDIDEGLFRHRLSLFVLVRILQVLGAYGLRGYVERKKYFLDNIPLAIENLQLLLAEGTAAPYHYLNDTLQRMVNLPRFKDISSRDASPTLSQYDGRGDLVVRIYSFSYKKGIPEDPTGNGGGYVFDCRSTHNPGRYEQYKHLTGLDAPVIKFLEDDGEITTFLNAVYQLSDKHVKRYIERGFTSLMFCFGCTGGQHRSVYSAQHLAEHLHNKFGVEVILYHREQGIQQHWNKNEVSRQSH